MRARATALALSLACACPGGAQAARAAADYPIRAAGLLDVRVSEGFWADRLATNRLVTLATDFAKCNETPRIANFTNCAARAKGGKFGGIYFDDSDVYKVMEGAAYVWAGTRDPAIASYMDWLIGQVAGAQEPDGYLYTARTLGGHREIDGTARWENLSYSHELYNSGHMIEAAVAWYEATGKTNFLAVAVRNADLLDRTFGWEPGKLRMTSGHQEVELALCRLYRATGEARYLRLAKFLLDVRGRPDLRKTFGPDSQDHKPVLEQEEAIGHAVRANYMYCAMTDVAALAGDRRYAEAVKRLWEDVVGRKMYLTGGVGARHCHDVPGYGTLHEAYNAAYDLPNDEAYNETCAAIATALWNQRLFCLTGEAKYVDVLERVLYNGFASGISLTGDEFFYPNPLANNRGYRRSKWFDCSCCPVNDVRFIPQVPTFAYAAGCRGALYWNLFMSGSVEIDGAKLACETKYPWDGRASLRVLGLAAGRRPEFALKVRIPGWARGRSLPSDLYEQLEPASAADVRLSVNGRPEKAEPGEDGYVALDRAWSAGDTVELVLPMAVRRVRAHPSVAADRGRLAVERGPVVYCAEGADNGGKAHDAVLPADASFKAGSIAIGDRTYPSLEASTGLVLVPYCLWGNRRPGNEMQVWLRER